MKYIRPFIVLHSALEYDKNCAMIVYIDAIRMMKPHYNGDNINEGTVIQIGNMFYNVSETLENILRKIENAERGKDDKDN